MIGLLTKLFNIRLNAVEVTVSLEVDVRLHPLSNIAFYVVFALRLFDNATELASSFTSGLSLSTAVRLTFTVPRMTRSLVIVSRKMFIM